MTTNMCHKQIKLILINQEFEDWNFYETVQFAVVLSCINTIFLHEWEHSKHHSFLCFWSTDHSYLLINCPFTVSDTNALDALFYCLYIGAAQAVQEVLWPFNVTHNATVESGLGNAHCSLLKPASTSYTLNMISDKDLQESQSQHQSDTPMEHVFTYHCGKSS